MPSNLAGRQNQRAFAYPAVSKVTGDETALTTSKTSMAKLSCPDIDKYQFLNININTNNQTLSVKGKMKENLMFWKSIETNSKVIEIIDRGYKIPFIDTPKSAHFCNSSAFENF